MENRLKKVIIYGGGIIGGLSSLCLERNGFDVCHVTSKIKKDQDRTFALSPGSIDWLKTCGFKDDFFETLYPIKKIEISRENATTTFTSDSVFEPALAYMCSEKNLMKEITSKIQSKRIKIYLEPKELKLKKSNDHVLIELDDKKISASILMACDGANSIIKEHLNIKKKVKNFNQSAFVFNFKVSKNILSHAKQYFLKNSILALLPISSKTFSVVWSCDQSFFEKLKEKDDINFIIELKKIVGNDYGKILNISKRNTFPLSMVLNNKFFDQRIVLMGNAAHAIHPLAGQGLNLGIRDIIDFEKCFKSYPYSDIGLDGFLRRFERSRRIDTFEFSTLTSGLQWIFSRKSKLINKALIKGIKFLETRDNIKNFLIKKAIS